MIFCQKLGVRKFIRKQKERPDDCVGTYQFFRQPKKTKAVLKATKSHSRFENKTTVWLVWSEN